MTDIKLQTDGDLDLSGGDIHYAEATGQHMKDILLHRKGDYRLAPTATVGLEDFLDDERPDDLNREIRVRFGQDGLTIRSMKNNGRGKIDIDADY